MATNLPTLHRKRALTAALLTGALVLTACNGSDDGDTAAQVNENPRETIGSVDTWPLTGLPVADGNSEQPFPVLVTKMDNTASSAPQRGLGKADMVVEELVEGGLTRLAAFYFSELPREIGPVRSMRASDLGIVSPVRGTMVTSGAAPITISRLGKAGVHYVTEGSAGFYRAGDRPAPYNLMTDLGKVAKAEKSKPSRPSNYLPWGSAKDLPKGKPASQVDVQFSGGHTTQWAFRNGGYVNDNSYAAEGDEFPADSVLVLRVKVGDAGYLDPGGNYVPETKFEGTGDATLFHDGRMIMGSWAKDSLEAPLELSTKDGDLKVPAGHVWIELVPRDGGNVTATP